MILARSSCEGRVAAIEGFGMRRERIEERKPKRRRPLEILPLDPRDPDILHAKELTAKLIRRRRPAV